MTADDGTCTHIPQVSCAACFDGSINPWRATRQVAVTPSTPLVDHRRVAARRAALDLLWALGAPHDEHTTAAADRVAQILTETVPQ